MNAVLDSRPLFLSPDAALRFAFGQQYGELAETILAKMSGTPRRKGNGLGGLDGYGQAGMILATVSELPAYSVDIVTATYSPIFGKCECGSACCVGYRHYPRWIAAVDRITQSIGPMLPVTLPHQKLREAAVRKFFGEKLLFSAVVDECRVHRNTASQHKSRIDDLLKRDKRRALSDAESKLWESGLVGD